MVTLMSALLLVIGITLAVLASHGLEHAGANLLAEQTSQQLFNLGLALTLGGAWLYPLVRTITHIFQPKEDA